MSIAFVCVEAAVLVMAFLAVYYPTLRKLIEYWAANDTYSYGFFVPLISGYLVWLRRGLLKRLPSRPSFGAGGLVLAFGLVMFIVGVESSTNLVEELSLPITLWGVVLLVLGKRVTRSLTFPLLYLFMMIPFWDFLTRGLQEPFQLYSAVMGVGALRLFDIPVFRDGVFIYLPDITLEVADVCSGVNNLVAVLCIGVPLTHFYVRGWVKRCLVIGSAILIALLSNGIRVAIVSLFAYYGIRGADGDIHGPFSLARSLLISAVGFVVLFWLIARFADKAPVDVPTDSAGGGGSRQFAVVGTAWALAIAMLVATVGFSRWYDVTPVALKSDFVSFPNTIGHWQLQGASSGFSPFAKVGFDNMLARRYVAADGSELELLVGYFARQRQGRELSGFELSSLVPGSASPLTTPVDATTHVKDYLMTSTERETYHVTYWYFVDGRVATENYQVKWWTTWNSLIKRRNNGALVVVKVKVDPREGIDRPRARVKDFVEGVVSSAGAHFDAS